MPAPVPIMLIVNAVMKPIGAPSHQPMEPPTLAPMKLNSLPICVSCLADPQSRPGKGDCASAMPYPKFRHRLQQGLIMGRAAGFAVLLLALAPVAARAQAAGAGVDRELAAYIARIRAVDNHAHPMRPVAAGAPADSEFDALPLDGIPPFALPWRLRLENPEWAATAKALYGVRVVDTGAAGTAALNAARAKAIAQQGQHFPEWVLDQAGIEVEFGNRIVMGPGLAPPRFRWVAFDDALMLPLDSRFEAARTPDTRSLYPREAKLLQRYLHDLGISALPPTLDAYMKNVVTATLERQKRDGAVAIKFEVAYLRPLDFGAADAAVAARVYARYARGGAPSIAEYRTLEDYLFRAIAREAGRLGLAVHIHVFEGFGAYYDLQGSDPRLLEPVFEDTTLRATRFVIIHGGWPRAGETQSLLSKANVYADISMMDLVLEPTTLAGVLRQWLAEWPDKVLFGTDAFDGGAEQSWGDVAYFATRSARKALGLALTGMMRDGEITRDRANALARMVLRENANGLYGLNLK